jgi:hypothetical protein
LPPTPCLDTFLDRQLSLLLLCSVPVADIADCRRHTYYTGPDCGSDSELIGWFWALLQDIHCPLEGSPRLTITRIPYDVRLALPTAATCLNLLRLPSYGGELELHKRVISAILHGSEGLSFYYWRGAVGLLQLAAPQQQVPHR